jgi:hypothetical protein
MNRNAGSWSRAARSSESSGEVGAEIGQQVERSDGGDARAWSDDRHQFELSLLRRNSNRSANVCAELNVQAGDVIACRRVANDDAVPLRIAGGGSMTRPSERF